MLSMARIAGVPLFLWLVLGPERDGLALIVLMVSGATDYLDGYLARRWNQTSRLGQLLDPAADRLYILATLIGLTIRDIVPLWLVLFLVARDVMLTLCIPTLRRSGLRARAAGALPGQGGDLQPALRLPVPAPRGRLGRGAVRHPDPRERVRLGVRDLGDGAVLVGRRRSTSCRSAAWRSASRRESLAGAAT